MIFKYLCRFVATVAIFFIIPGLAPAAPYLDKIGFEDVTEDDFVYLLSRQMNSDLDVAALAWVGMNEEQRKTFVSHVEDILLLSEAARLKGLGLNKDVARQIRWDEVNTLAKAYVDRMTLGWDLSDQAVEKYYKANKERYRAPARVLAKVRLCDAKDALLYATVQGDDSMGDPRWFSLEDVPAPLRAAFFQNLRLGEVPPMRSSDGSIWIARILEFQGSQILPLKFVRDEVKKDLQGAYLSEELARLKKKISDGN